MKPTLRDLTMIPIMTAAVAALGLMPPIHLAVVPVPITLQTLGVMLAGLLLGGWRGALSQVLLLALVAVGAPVLSGGRGGLGALVGPSAGFLWAWPLGAALTGYLAERAPRAGAGRLFLYSVLGGIGVIYLIGIPVMGAVSNMPLGAAATGSLVFLPGDLIKAGVAAVCGVAVRRGLASAGIRIAQSGRHAD